MKIVRLLILTYISVFFGAGSVFAASCSKNAKLCNNTQLCIQISFKSVYTWANVEQHITEAKRRGLTCGVQGARVQTDTAALDALLEQLDKANAELATTKQKLAAANEKEVDLSAKLITSLIAQNESDTTVRKLRENLTDLTARYDSDNAKSAGEIAGLRADLLETRIQNVGQQAALSELTARYDGLRATSTATIAELQDEARLLQAKINAQVTRLESLNAESSGYQNALLEATRAIAELRAELAKTREAAKQANTNQMTEAETRTALLSKAKEALSKEKAISAKARREMALLNQQVAALRTQLQNLQGLLDDAMAKDIAEDTQLQNLGSQLNSALARIAAEQRKRRRLEEAERKRLEREALELQRDNAELSAEIKEPQADSGDTPIAAEDTSLTVDFDSTDFELTDEQKIELQAALKERGFYSGAIDGDIGPASKRSIKAWQKDRDYSATGELTAGQRDELLLVEAVTVSADNAVDFVAGIEVETEKAAMTSEPVSTIGQRITSIEAELTNPDFDVYSCAFYLEFSNVSSGKVFDVVMYAEGGNGKFTASQNDIQEALADRELTAADNDWTQLQVMAKKFDNPNVVCQPKNNLLYVIKKESRENIFEIDPDGHLTVKGLQIIGIAENDTTKIAEREVDQRITSVVGQIANTDFDIAKCSFILEFTNSSSGKSFDLVINPVNGEFIATKNDIEDALADAELTDKQNEWPLLTGQVKKFDYPFVSCLPANQIIYGISRDATANTFKISQEGQLTINNVSLITANAKIYSDKKKQQVKAELTQEGQIAQPENENFVWYELIKKANISYANIAKNNFLSLGFSNLEIFQIRQNSPEKAIALGPFKNKQSMDVELKVLIGQGRLNQYRLENIRSTADYYLKVE